MMMPIGTMHVAVLQFFGAGFAHLDHFDREMQGLAGQRMVAVDGDFIAFDLGDDDGDRGTSKPSRTLACRRGRRLRLVGDV